MGEWVVWGVLLVGAAGAGKSRLRIEFVRRVPPEVECWSGRGDPMRSGSPFGLLAAAVRRAAGVQDGAPAEQKWARLRARVERHVPNADVHRVAEFIGEMVGAPSAEEPSTQLRAARYDATLMGDQTQRAWLELVAGECAAHPLLLVLEDLQWGDAPSIRLVDAALRVLPDQPLFVVALARPEVFDVFPRLWDERVHEVRVGELGKRACETLVRQIRGDDTALEHVARLVERSAGNAFYLEELVRAAAAGLDDLPGTVLAMVQARLEALGAEARRVLRAASVFGEIFWSGGVPALLGEEGDAGQVAHCLGA